MKSQEYFTGDLLEAGAAHFSNDISVATNGIKDFCRLCETCDGLLTHQLVEEFGTLLLKQCYFPGLGLTGGFYDIVGR